MRHAVILGSALAIATTLAATATSFAQDAYTTRIEPTPSYGATVTIENGVRVFRPLPTTRHVIVNPNNTPLYLGQYQFGGRAPVLPSHGHPYGR